MRFANAKPGEPAHSARLEFEAFFHRNHRELARLAYTLTGNRDDADDITAEVFASVWEHWGRVQAADHPISYVRKMVVNLGAERIRRAVRERHKAARLATLTRWFHPGPDVGTALDLQAAVLTLPAGRRACVVLRHVLDLSEEEAARTLGISRGTVKSQTSKGLAQLRRTLSDGADGSAPTSGAIGEIPLGIARADRP